ncbi:MAG: hypothetical protein GX752_02285 [Clostridium sp.]|nr:hypothetical protein [Clostridium sp.]
MTNKKKYSLIALIVIVLLGGAFFTYDVLALEKEKSHAAEAYDAAVDASLEAQREIDEKIINDWEDKVYPGVTILDVDFSGDTKEDAKAKIDSKIKPLIEENSVKVNAAEEEFNLLYKDLELNLDSDKIVDDALSVGKDLDFDEKIKRIEAKEYVEADDISVTYTFNEEKLDGFVKEIESKVNQSEKNATIKVSGGSFNVTAEKDGRALKADETKAEIKEAVLDLEKENPEIEAEVVVTKPKVKAEDLNKVNGVLSSYKTSYGNSTSGRINNIGIAASKISQSVIMPGEVFSYNEALGSITTSNGFQNAGVIKGNKIEDGIGGGICQVSSTLYQAAVHSGVGIAQRRNHSMKVFYLDAGLDAVVYSPSLDLKLKNNYSSPIVIHSYSGGGTINVVIYGNTSDMGGKSYRVYSKVNSVNKPSTTRRANASMYEGTQEVVVPPVTGYTSTTYRDIVQGGKVIKTEVLSNDSYKRVDGIVEYGTKKREAAPAPAAEAPAPEEPAVDPDPAP